jgi:hypothetical protein
MILFEVREISRPGFVMSIVRPLPHPAWILVATLAGSMLATADASAREMGSDRFCTDLMCLRPCADRFAIANVAHGFGAAPHGNVEQGSGPAIASVDRLADGGRSEGLSTVRPAGSPRPHFDAEDLEDCSDGDDDTDVPVRAWMRDRARARIVLPDDDDCRSDLFNPLLVSSPSYQRLRC